MEKGGILYAKNLRRFGRDDWIRTSDLCVPNAALYQTEPHPEADIEGYLLLNSPG
jgi:hypothetical protein